MNERWPCATSRLLTLESFPTPTQENSSHFDSEFIAHCMRYGAGFNGSERAVYREENSLNDRRNYYLFGWTCRFRSGELLRVTRDGCQWYLQWHARRIYWTRGVH